MNQTTRKTTLELYGLDERGQAVLPQTGASRIWPRLDSLVFPVTMAFMLSLSLLPLMPVFFG